MESLQKWGLWVNSPLIVCGTANAIFPIDTYIMRGKTEVENVTFVIE